MIALLPILLSIFCAQDGYVTEKLSSFILENNRIGINVSKNNGTTTLYFKDTALLLKDVPISIFIEPYEDSMKMIEIETADHYPEYGVIRIRKESSSSSVDFSLTIDSISLLIKAELTGKTKKIGELTVNFNLSIGDLFSHISYPHTDTPMEFQKAVGKKYVYRNNMFIPMLAAYRAADDFSLSLVAPFEVSKPGLSFLVDDSRITVSFDHLRLTKDGKTTAALYVFPHQGAWRPAFRFLRDKYKEYFQSPVCKTLHGDGLYYQAMPYHTERTIEDIADKGTGWVEFHYYFPFLGLYAPDMQDWGLIADSDEISIDEWERGAGRNRNSYTKTNTLINLWHKHRMQVYMYFQPFEAWYQYATKYFRNDIARDESRNSLPSWKFTNLMNPDPQSKWGAYIIDQAEKMLEKYPAIEGIFYDRMDYWNYDFAHDDGTTMAHGQPAYMLGFAQQRINDEIFGIMHRAGKGVWGNGPTSIEVCKNLDGIMAETSVSLLRKLQYLALARPLIYLAYDKNPYETEEKLKNALVCGAFPSITYGGDECQKLDNAYRPVFDLMYSREWVLHANPLNVPDDYQANIFKRPDSTYVAYIINPEKSRLPPHPFDYDIPITINLPDAHDIEHVYLLSGDWAGVNAVEFTKTAQSLHMELPCHLASSALHLTKSNMYDVVRISKPILIKGQNEDIIFRVLDFDDVSKQTFTLELPWDKETKTLDSEIVVFHTKVPETMDGELIAKIGHNEKVHVMSFWAVDPISIAPKELIFIKFQDGEDVPFYVTNNTNIECTVNLTGTFIEGEGLIQPINNPTLLSHENRKLDIPIMAKTNGLIELTIKAHGKDIQKTFPVRAALSFSPEDLFHDDFKGGMVNWSISQGTWKVSNNIATGSGPSHLALISNNEWHNYEFEVRTKILGSNDSAIGWLKSYIFFRVQDENNFYRFGIHGGYDVVSLYKNVNGTWAEIAAHHYVAQADQWYTLKIVADESAITGYVNGKELVAVVDTTFSSGGIGIGVLEDRMVIQYKDVVVKQINN